MKTPDFWANEGGKRWLSDALLPLAGIYQLGYRLHRLLQRPLPLPVPVMCVGNLTAGGAGKTPTVIAIGRYLQERGVRVHILSRGYGGDTGAPRYVTPDDDPATTGDEPLVIARHLPCWVGHDRRASAMNAIEAGAELLLLDDGFQRRQFVYDRAMLVVDGPYGTGNGRLFPAGPLRESWRYGIKRADAVLVIGDDRHGVANRMPASVTMVHGTLIPQIPDALQGKRLLAFCGIGRPAKFTETLEGAGLHVVDSVAFADHHIFRDEELSALLRQAQLQDAMLVTTEKDWVRLSPDWRTQIAYVPITLNIAPEVALSTLLSGLYEGGGHDP